MKKEINTQITMPAKKRFLQPLALALVCIVLILLLFIIRWVDLRALDTTLTSYMNNSAKDTIGTVQSDIDFYYNRLIPVSKNRSNAKELPLLSEDAVNLKERLMISLIESAQDVEYQMEDPTLKNEYLASASDAENLWLISFVDKNGIPSSQNQTIPENLIALAAPVAQGFEEIKVNLFDPTLDNDGAGYLIIRQKSGKGAILLAFKEKNLRYWCLKLSIQITLENLGQVQDFEYIQLTDRSLNIYGQIGNVPPIQIEDPDIINFLKNAAEPLSRNILFDDINLLEITSPVHLTGGEIIFVRLGLNRDDEEHIIRESRNSLFISMGFMAVISILAMMLLYINQNRHLARIQEMQRRMLQAERLSALGRLAAGVAHEIRNPLNAISMATQRLQKENLPALTGVIRDEIRRLNQIIEEFLTFSRSSKLDLKNRDLSELLDQIALLFDEEANSRNITIERQWSENSIYTHMDLNKMKQALLNIIKNAMESISDKGTITISMESKGKWINLKIADTGTGLNQEEVKKIFDPDYTTKEKGLGLGLPLAHEIIKGHDGEIKVTSQPGKGTSFEILLPMVWA